VAGDKLKPEEILNVSYEPADRDWLTPTAVFRKGTNS
jgi:hypothetical protein